MAANEQRLSEAIREMASFSVVDNGLPDILHKVTALATDTIDVSAFAGLTMSVRGHLQTPVYTDDAAPEIDSAQYATGIGPCVDTYRTGVVNRILATAEDTRWKAFSEACQHHGVLSTLSLPVKIADETFGALNLYALEERAFDDDAETLGVAFAHQASVVIGNAKAYWDARALGDQLTQALETRVTIAEAKGLLMATGLTSDEAFEMLRRRSQRENRKLQTIAAEMVAKAERLAASK